MARWAIGLVAVGALLTGLTRAFGLGGAALESAGGMGTSRVIADHFVSGLRQRDYLFLTEDKLESLRGEIEQFTVRFWPARMNLSERQSLLSAIDRHVPELFLNRHVDSADAWSFMWDNEGAYRKFRDLVNTFKWQLWQALIRDPLTPEQLSRRQAQHEWLRQFIAGVPARPGDWLPIGVAPDGVRAWVSARLEQMLVDPLGLLCDPMTDPQFEVFKEWMKRIAANGLVTTVADVPVRALGARAHESVEVEAVYSYPFDIALPFEDEVRSIYGGGEGSGPHLVFTSNARFRGQEVYLHARSRPIFDIVAGVCVVPAGKDPLSEDFLAWWEKEQTTGDLAYEDAIASIVGIRGARIVELKVANWFEADRVSEAGLRRFISENGRTRISVVRLPPMNGPRRVGESDPRFFVILQNRENRLAVLDLRSREFGGLHFVSRSR